MGYHWGLSHWVVPAVFAHRERLSGREPSRGGLSERPMEPVLKTGDVKAFVGSNPTPPLFDHVRKGTDVSDTRPRNRDSSEASGTVRHGRLKKAGALRGILGLVGTIVAVIVVATLAIGESPVPDGREARARS